MGGSSKGAERQAQAARDDEERRRQRIESGTRSIRNMFRGAFDDYYYDDLKKAGEAFYEPQVTDQYQASLKDLRAALYRSGLGGAVPDATAPGGMRYLSSVGKQMEGDLADKKDRAMLDVTNSVRGTVNQRRQQVANAEMQAIGQLQSSADANAAAAQAHNLISTNTQPEAWSPLGQVFTDATAGLATQAQLERAGNARYNTGLFGGPSNSRRYTTNVGAV